MIHVFVAPKPSSILSDVRTIEIKWHNHEITSSAPYGHQYVTVFYPRPSVLFVNFLRGSKNLVGPKLTTNVVFYFYNWNPVRDMIPRHKNSIANRCIIIDQIIQMKQTPVVRKLNSPEMALDCGSRRGITLFLLSIAHTPNSSKYACIFFRTAESSVSSLAISFFTALRSISVSSSKVST